MHKLELIFDWPIERRKISCPTPSLAKQTKTTASCFEIQVDTTIFLDVGCNSLQGPALYAYNNAEFSPDDWEGIRMLCVSKKDKDPMKVGRFGLGFKSVFHVTGKLVA